MDNPFALRRNRITLGSFLALIAILLAANFAMVGPYVLAVVMGSILAILARRPAAWLQAKIGPRAGAAVVTIVVTLLVVVPVGIFLFLAASQAVEIARRLLEEPGLSPERIARKLTLWKPMRVMVGDAADVEAKLREGLEKLTGLAPAYVFKFAGGIPESVLKMVLGLLSCYFLLVDGPTFLGWLRDKLPLDPEVRGAIFNSFRDTAMASTTATISAASVQALIMLTAFLLLGLPAAFLAGGVTFLAAWVPLVGSTPLWLSTAGYLFFQGSTGKALCLVGAGALTGLSDNIVYPLVLKGRGQMHPLVSLVAIFGGIQMFGLFGVFIGPILASLLVATVSVWPRIAERFGILQAAQVITAPGDVVSPEAPAPAPPLILPPDAGP